MKKPNYLNTTSVILNILLLGILLVGSCSSRLQNSTSTPTDTPTRVNADHITVTADKMNVLYIGVSNPITVNVPNGDPNNVTVTAIGGGAQLQKEAGDFAYSIKVNRTGECRIIVKGDRFEKTTVFKVKRIPMPIAQIGGGENKYGGVMANGIFKAQAGLTVMLNDFDFDAKCKVVGFNFVRSPKRQDRVESINAGAIFNAKSKRLLMAASPGDAYIFRNVKAKCPGDAASRVINSLVFSIR